MLVSALLPTLKEVSSELLRAGIDTKHMYMRDCSRMFDNGGEFPNATRAEREVLHVPAHPGLSDAQIDRVAAALGAAVRGPDSEQGAEQQ